MKSKFLRILALILVMSSLISTFAIFATAEETAGGGDGTEMNQGALELIYNRTYDEGWDVNNGMTTNGENTTFEIDYEKNGDKYNYFWRMTVGTDANEYLELLGAEKVSVGSVIEFDIMADSTVSVSNPVVVLTNGTDSSDATPVDLMRIENNNVYLLGADEVSFTMESSGWYRIQLVFDYANSKLVLSYVPVDGSAAAKVIEVAGAQGNGISAVRFQSSAADTENIGNSLCFDNLKYYEGVNQVTDITAEMGYGSAIDEDREKTEEILGGSGSSGSSTGLAKALSMKVGVNYYYDGNARTPIFENDGVAYGAPVKVDGKVMVPLLRVLDYLNAVYFVQEDGAGINIEHLKTNVVLTVGSNTANVAGEAVALNAAPAYAEHRVNDETVYEYLVIALDDVEKLFKDYYSDYDDMGYMVISKTPDMLDRNDNLNEMLSIMKEFVFDRYDGESLYNDVKNHTGFVHPYILADGEKLTNLYNEYQALLTENEATPFLENSEKFWKLRGYNNIVASGEVAYEIFACLDANGTYETYNGLLPIEEIPEEYSITQTYSKQGGYDDVGRSNITVRTQLLEDMTYAYVLTKDTKYLELAYEVAIYLGTWDHWGPGNFIDCADAANDFAIYYDWTYQGYAELVASGVKRTNGYDYDVAALAEILARHGVHEGYLSNGNRCDHLSIVYRVDNQEGYSYFNRTNSWNAVCVSGMTVAALAVFDGNAGEAYVSEAKEMLGNNLNALIDNGLDIYAPDGAYIEGASAWNHGTNSFLRMCAALDSATGGNYGLMDCWGIDTTCYYAYHTEDNNSNYFPYHDSIPGSHDTSYFFYVANYFGDATLYNARLTQINSDTKDATIFDFLYYPTADDLDGKTDIQLDYYSEKIDLFATRSSWEKDALYASIMGGSNSYPHGQVDAGSFVYHNGGNVWICDIGNENHGCKGIWDTVTRYRYYVMKPEGNNTIAISTDPSGTPYGQSPQAEAKATDWGSNEHGSYVIYDMGNALGAQVSNWDRGMLLTNDRKTTVIQDQITFNSMSTAYWFAHYNTGVVDGGISISEDGRVAYLRDYVGTDEHGNKLYKTLRLSIVSANKSYRFQLMTTYQFIHTTGSSATYTPDEINALGGASENRRDDYRKLAISSGEALGFNIAVVIELVDDTTVGKSTEIGVGYEYVNMSTWEPTADMRGLEVDDGDSVERRGIPNADVHLVQSIEKIKGMTETLYTDSLEEYFLALADAHYAVNMIGSDMPSSYSSYVTEYQAYRTEFSNFRKALTDLSKDQLKLINKLMSLG